MVEETPKPNGHDDENPAEMRVLSDTLLDRLRFFRQAGVTFGGARRLYEAFGYDETITARQYRERYSRGGVAGRIVDALPNATWRGDVELIEDENPKASTEFEKAWEALSTRLRVISMMCRVDKLSRLSTYAVLLIGVADGNLEQELPKGKSQEQILFLTPFAGGGGPGLIQRAGIGQDLGSAYIDATIRDLDLDPTSSRFGLPLFYQLRRLDAGSPLFQKPVHWSRVIHVAENTLDNEVYGQPALERCWNLLDDLDKVTGGGAEAFFLRANPGLHVNVDKDMSLTDATNDLTNLADQIEKWRHKMSDRAFRTKGVDVNMLASDVANFSQPADAILTQIAGATSMPKRILTGSEMGELASSQDRDNWKDQVNGRQTGHAGPNILQQFADRLIAYGYLPKPTQYEIHWAHMQVLTEDEKASGATKWAQVNSTAGVTVFSAEEIRDHWYGLEPGDDVDTEMWKADLAVKMAETNKTEGAVIFTDDEIRKTCYGWEPLKPEQKIPLTAPERVTATAPTPEIDAQGRPIPAKAAPAATPAPAFPRAAEDIETLRVLRAAIEENNLAVIDAILGVRHAGGAGSGNFGHGGRPGEIGGSTSEAATLDTPGHTPLFGPMQGPPSALAMKAFLAANAQKHGLMTKLNAVQKAKLHGVLSTVISTLSDPDIGHLVIQALSTVDAPGSIERKLEEIERDMAYYVGGHEPAGRKEKDVPRAAASKEVQLEKIRELLALLRDPDSKAAVQWLLDEIRKAGTLDTFMQKLKDVK